MQRMQERQDRWRSRTSENPRLKNLQHHQVNSAIEMVVNEGLESMYMRKQAIVIINLVLGKQLVYWMK